ncbi:MAG: hypothetical protein KatS3mg102_0636 [Planctomycetota bacterium]|nr:MAG: hypothetical protein KatS3mg102_0636 [Planctomycetota bacterium]
MCGRRTARGSGCPPAFPLLWLLALATAPAAVRAETQDLQYELRIATAAPEGTYHRVGQALGRIIQARGGSAVRVRIEPSGGSVDNLRRLARGEVQAAIVQEDVLRAAWKGEELFSEPVRNVRAIGALFLESVHLLVRPGGGDPPGGRAAGPPDRGGPARQRLQFHRARGAARARARGGELPAALPAAGGGGTSAGGGRDRRLAPGPRHARAPDRSGGAQRRGTAATRSPGGRAGAWRSRRRCAP